MFSEVNFLTQQVPQDHLPGVYLCLFSTRIPINFPRKKGGKYLPYFKGNTNPKMISNIIRSKKPQLTDLIAGSVWLLVQ